MPHAHINGFKMHYDVSGEGEALLLLHGLGSSRDDWQLQTPFLAQSWRVIAPDCRGHGGSDRPPGPYSIKLFASDVEALLESLEVSQAHVLGISMGGLVAQQLALDAPRRVRSLVLVNTFSHLIISGLGALPGLLRRAFILQFFSMERIGRFIGRRLFPRPEQKELRLITARRWAQNDKKAYRAASLAVLRFNVTERLGEIACPTLIISGANDHAVAPRHLEVLRRGIAGSRLVVIPDSTHATPIDQPQAFNRTVLEFLASVQGTKIGGQDEHLARPSGVAGMAG